MTGLGSHHHSHERAPPFGTQIILNGHEYVAHRAQKEGVTFRKEDNCFTQISEPTHLAQIADT